MNSNRRFYRLLVLPALVLVATLLVLATCQRQEQADEATPPADAEARTTQPESPTAAPEAIAEESTGELTRETASDVATVPTEEPAPAAANLEVHVSVTEFFSVQVPDGWSTAEVIPGADFVMANSEAALERHSSGSGIEPGDLVLNVGFIPYRLLQTNELRALDFQFDASPDLFLQSLLPMFRTDDSLDISDPELVSLNDQRDAGVLTVSAEGREGMILMFSAGDSVIALVSAIAFPGEMGQFQELANAIAAGVSFSGAQDALYGTLLGG